MNRERGDRGRRGERKIEGGREGGRERDREGEPKRRNTFMPTSTQHSH